MPLMVRGTTALFSGYYSYCKPYATVMWRHPRRECTRDARLPCVLLEYFRRGKELVSKTRVDTVGELYGFIFQWLNV